MSANIDRRTFLAGTTAGSLVLLSLGGCNKPDENKGAIKTSAGSDSGQAKPHYAMVFDQNKCIGCGLCKEACNETNKLPKGVSRLVLERQTTHVPGTACPICGKLEGCDCERVYVRVSAVSGRTVRSRLPDRSSTSRSEYRHRDDGSGPLCRLQVLHCRLSLQRSIYQLRNKSGGQLRLLSEDQIGRRRGTRLRTSLPTQRLVFRRCERSAKHHQPSAACQRYGSYSSAFGNGAKSQIHHS